ncbi:unnamed protein product [Heligmosomoides polygyrus]|uniref:Uncharacterized protein n=1 Tax=Heligmosomoides polygyrus TaxID=6339 RepID=A0A183G599_HELPZ|nr:unnamed protein product [Heligmosomoides polygyrus]
MSTQSTISISVSIAKYLSAFQRQKLAIIGPFYYFCPFKRISRQARTQFRSTGFWEAPPSPNIESLSAQALRLSFFFYARGVNNSRRRHTVLPLQQGASALSAAGAPACGRGEKKGVGNTRHYTPQLVVVVDRARSIVFGSEPEAESGDVRLLLLLSRTYIEWNRQLREGVAFDFNSQVNIAAKTIADGSALLPETRFLPSGRLITSCYSLLPTPNPE